MSVARHLIPQRGAVQSLPGSTDWRSKITAGSSRSNPASVRSAVAWGGDMRGLFAPNERKMNVPREKIKFALRMAPETQQLVKEMCPRDNRQTQNEFIERAIRFHAAMSHAKRNSLLSCCYDGIFGSKIAKGEGGEDRFARISSSWRWSWTWC